MKGVIIFLALLIIMPFAAAVDGELRNLEGVCDSSGNAKISMMHLGGAIKTDEIDIYSYHLNTRKNIMIRGNWDVNDKKNVLYISGEYSKVTFKTTNNPFQKKGEYDLHFLFLAKQQDFQPTDVVVGFECPGAECSIDAECEEDAICMQGSCTGLRCKSDEFMEHHECVPKCNDMNPCTIDIYENGTCTYKRKQGECCRTDADCNLGLACSTDKCVESRCVSTPVLCQAANDKCVYAFCVEPTGCKYETNDACLSGENEKREYLIVVGNPSVNKKSFFAGFFEAIGNFFKNLF